MKIIDLGWLWRSLTTSTVGYSSDSWASCCECRCPIISWDVPGELRLLGCGCRQKVERVKKNHDAADWVCRPWLSVRPSVAVDVKRRPNSRPLWDQQTGRRDQPNNRTTQHVYSRQTICPARLLAARNVSHGTFFQIPRFRD